MPPVKTFGERIADALVEDSLLSAQQVGGLAPAREIGPVGVQLVRPFGRRRPRLDAGQRARGRGGDDRRG